MRYENPVDLLPPLPNEMVTPVVRGFLVACSAVGHVGRRLGHSALVPRPLSIPRGGRIVAGAPPAVAASSSSGSYDHATVEAKWQRYWEEHDTFRTERRPDRPKKYVLDMFPYPSGAGLHVGHPEGYTASDIMARYWRMTGHDVLHPMGWDSFGLPAEQHAIQTGTHPRDTTAENIANFKRQLKALGFSYDWSREIATTDEEYVRWTQWIFLQLFHRGLATQSEVPVNWCAGLGTVLANEEVIDGKSERGDFPVERLPLRQWVLRITEYADKLEAGLEGLRWPEGTRTAQRQWIGRSEGATITFDVADDDEGHALEVFTTRPDTLMGVTYVVVAPEHPLLDLLTVDAQADAVKAYAEAARVKSDLDRTATGSKSGVPTGAHAVHPISGDLVPIWVSDYVIGGYGTGAVMAVPAHDERDFAFAAEFGLPVKRVVAPEGLGSEDAAAAGKGTEAPLEEAFTDYGVAVNSGDFDGLSTEECKKAIIAKVAALDKGGPRVNYKLRDWVFSRQRYWGEPIPIYFPVDLAEGSSDPREGDPHTIRYDEPIAVDEADLPVRLPELDDFSPGDSPEGCLARATHWRYFEKDGRWFARETNTMPQWAGSCWYYLRFMDPANPETAWSPETARQWLPVDLYVGGAEHAVLHLLYARFWHQVLYDAGYVPCEEPFAQLVHQGMILGADGEKMSKSRGNVVNPDDIVDEYGADAMRLYEMFMGPLDAVKPWQTEQISGVVRFRDKVVAVVGRADETVRADDETTRIRHQTVKKVTQQIEELGAPRAGRGLWLLGSPGPATHIPAVVRTGFNVAISALMVFTNHLASIKGGVDKEACEVRALPGRLRAHLVGLTSSHHSTCPRAHTDAGPHAGALRPARERGAVEPARPLRVPRARAVAHIRRGPHGRVHRRPGRADQRQGARRGAPRTGRG